MRKQITLCINVNAFIITSLSVYAFLIPAGMLIRDLRDPGLEPISLVGINTKAS
jgi:hypothetical protein